MKHLQIYFKKDGWWPAKILALLLFVVAFSHNVQAADFVDTVETDTIYMVIGELESLKVHSLTRLSITKPAVADIVNASDEELLVIAKEEGQTALFIWDEHGKRVVMIHVVPIDLELIKDRITKLLEAAEIEDVHLEINGLEGRIIITGEVFDEHQEVFKEILEPFGNAVISLVQDEPTKDLVEIDMQITELNTTLNKTLGFDWNNSLQYDETIPSDLEGGWKDVFKVGDIKRSTALVSTVNALVEEGMGKILSKPKLVVVSGDSANFLVGGEIPIKTTTLSETGTAENVEFRDFGISMDITPTIVRDKIDIKLSVEVSEVDSSTAGTSSSDVGFSTRSASTSLYLDDGQTIVLAGLIKQTEGETIKKVPFFGDVPIVGLLFRKTSKPVADIDQELVISLTPYILTDRKADKANKMAAAAAAEKEASMMDEAAVGMETVKKASAAVPYYMGIPREMSDYVRAIQQRISQSIKYPQEAQDLGWEGTVKVGLLILNDGTLAFASIKESSGHEIFDKGAVDTAKQMAPYSGFPPDTDLQELNITIPIVYSLKKN